MMSSPVKSQLDGVTMPLDHPPTATDNLQRLLNNRPPVTRCPWLGELRQRGLALASEQTIPTARDEEWRFTDLSALLNTQFEAVQEPLVSPNPSELTTDYLANTIRLVFVDGHYASHLSDVSGLPNQLIVTSFSQLTPDQYPLLQNYLGKQTGNEEVFTALNMACLVDGALIWLPPNAIVPCPIHLLFISSAFASPLAAYPRCLLVAQSGSQVTLVEEYKSLGAGVQFTNGVTEIWMDDQSMVTHVRVQRQNNQAIHIGKTAVSQGQNTTYQGVSVGLGGVLGRHNVEVVQVGEQSQTLLYGLNVSGEQQVIDTHTSITFTRPHGTSQQLQKAIAGDRSHTIFNGKLVVPKAAQLTDASQLNRTLLVSPKARVDTKPQLEIVADNVKCTHGATVSQLDGEEIFYLQSRGLPIPYARQLLVDAFTTEIISHIPLPQLGASLNQAIRQRVNHPM